MNAPSHVLYALHQHFCADRKHFHFKHVQSDQFPEDSASTLQGLVKNGIDPAQPQRKIAKCGLEKTVVGACEWAVDGAFGIVEKLDQRGDGGPHASAVEEESQRNKRIADQSQEGHFPVGKLPIPVEMQPEDARNAKGEPTNKESRRHSYDAAE